MSSMLILWLLMGAGLIVYVLTGGADFGSGFWYLFASGKNGADERRAIEHAIAPIWEANHVWLIFIIVLCFTVFSSAFYTISIALHVPLTVTLFGIVLRGAAFVFRTYGLETEPMRHVWGRVFALASVITPFFLGMSLGALSTGEIRVVDGRVASSVMAGWTNPFAWAVGLFAVVLFALLAAVYLTSDCPKPLRDAFRTKAIAAEFATLTVAMLVLWSALHFAPPIAQNFIDSLWLWPIQALTSFAALGVLLALFKRRFRWARIAVIAQVTCIVLGWGVGMRGYIVYPDVRFEDAASGKVIDAIAIALPLGMALIIPSLWYLFRIFKTQQNRED